MVREDREDRERMDGEQGKDRERWDGAGSPPNVVDATAIIEGAPVVRFWSVRERTTKS
jgi:hypothetical protein